MTDVAHLLEAVNDRLVAATLNVMFPGRRLGVRFLAEKRVLSEGEPQHPAVGVWNGAGLDDGPDARHGRVASPSLNTRNKQSGPHHLDGTARIAPTKGR